MKHIFVVLVFVLYSQFAMANEGLKLSSQTECEPIISILDNTNELGIIRVYEDYIDDTFKKAEPFYTLINLRLRALQNTHTKNQEILNIFVQSSPCQEEFVWIFSDAVKWATHEKVKTKEALYSLSKTYQAPLHPYLGHIESGIKREYLKLAAQKDHEEAKKEYKQYQKKLKNFIKKYDPDLSLREQIELIED